MVAQTYRFSKVAGVVFERRRMAGENCRNENFHVERRQFYAICGKEFRKVCVQTGIVWVIFLNPGWKVEIREIV